MVAGVGAGACAVAGAGLGVGLGECAGGPGAAARACQCHGECDCLGRRRLRWQPPPNGALPTLRPALPAPRPPPLLRWETKNKVHCRGRST